MRITHILTGILGLCTLLLLGSIINHTLKMQEASGRLVVATEKVKKLKKQQQELKQQIEQRNSPEYLEEQIRNKFNYTQQGEKLVILPPELQPQDAVDTAYILPSKASSQPAQAQAIWQEWLDLIW